MCPKSSWTNAIEKGQVVRHRFIVFNYLHIVPLSYTKYIMMMRQLVYFSLQRCTTTIDSAEQ